MARLIDFADYLNGKKEKQHIMENLEYIATREGVVLNDASLSKFMTSLAPSTAVHKMTDRQYDFMQTLLHNAPELKESISYETFQKDSNMYTASVFIAESMERLFVKDAKNEIYLKYISERPGVEKKADRKHGLFDAEGSADLSHYQNELKTHGGNVWRHIISLRREDAVMYEYETQDDWRELINNHISDHAHNIGIDSDRLRWVAAFHDEGYHPHIHLMLWSTDGTGYQDKEALMAFRKSLTKDVFADEIWLREQYKGEIREDFEYFFENSVQDLMDQAIRSAKGSLDSLAIQVLQLANSLPERKIQAYEYLPPQVKVQVSQIIKSVLDRPQVSPLLEKYLDSHRILASMYMKDESNAMKQYVEQSVQKIIEPQKGDRKKLQNYILKIANDLKQSEWNKKALLSYQMVGVQDKMRHSKWQCVDPKLGSVLIKMEMAIGEDPLAIIEHTQPFFNNREDALEAYLVCLSESNVKSQELQMIEKHFKESIPYDYQELSMENQSVFASAKIFQHILMAMEDGKIQADREAHRLFIAHRLDERNIKIQNARS